jgi:hypothetical protein
MKNYGVKRQNMEKYWIVTAKIISKLDWGKQAIAL